MASLVDLLTTQQPAAQPDQAEVQRLLQAKSGKASQQMQPTTNLAEQSALLTAKAQQAQQQAALTIADEQAKQQQAAQTQQFGIASKQQDQQKQQALQQFKIQESQLLQGLAHSNEELEFRKDSAQVEQMGHMLALQDKQYLSDLDKVGRERNLRSKLAFEAEINDIIMGEQLQSLLDKMGWKSSLNSSEREWNKQLAQIDINSALQIAKTEIAQQNQQAMWTGVGNLASEGAKQVGQSDLLKPSGGLTPDNKSGEFGG